MDMRILAILFITAGITGAAPPGIAWNPYANKNRPSPDRYNYFDAELLEVLTRHEDGNVLISPVAVKLALEMLMEGASGRSAEEIRNALRLGNENDSERKESKYQKWNSQQEEIRGNVLKIATRVFVSERYRINPGYETSLKKKFGSEVVRVRFEQPRQLAAVVNGWVTNATSGLVTRLADESSVDPDAKLMLANAVYFKGKWLHPFARENTIIECFKTANEECRKVTMMTESGSYEYAYIAKLDAEAINIPYEGGRFSVILLLPKKLNGSQQLSRDLVHVGLDEIISELRQQEVHVKIPKFSVESTADLRPYLQKLQILQVFTSRADLTRIFADNKESVLVNKVLHSAKLEVNEEGTEAAAAIGSLFVPLMGGSPTAFIADHPFLFFVREVATGTVLFSGRIERPDAEVKKKEVANEGRLPSIQPREGSTPLPGRSVVAGEEAEIRRNQGRQLHSQFLRTGNDRYHVRPMKGKNGKNTRKTNYYDAISFDNANFRLDHRGH